MSLDVYLYVEGTEVNKSSGIFIREDGEIKEISRKEWDRKFPNREPVVVESDDRDRPVYRGNITHNLWTMADHAGIYKHLWQPGEIGITVAHQLIQPLKDGLDKLKKQPEYFKQFNPSNGWGSYEGLVRFAENYLEACEQYPNATVEAWG